MQLQCLELYREANTVVLMNMPRKLMLLPDPERANGHTENAELPGTGVVLSSPEAEWDRY